jgi:acyl-CoA dehydrogenase
MRSDDWRSRLERLLADHGRGQAEAAARANADGVKLDRSETARAWHAELVDNDLAAPGWPESVGGLDLSLEDQLDYYRITTAARVPPHPCPLSFIVAPTLIQHGTPEQKERYLRPLLRADEFWCQGFSEPGAGSDLASLSTRAVRETRDDGIEIYRVTGQKVWTTMADRADWIFALVRTGEAGRNSEGITYLLISMQSEGVTVRPLRDISGANHFAEVFFDDVEVPVASRVGAEGEGWSIMRTSLGHERATAFLADEFKYRRTVDRVLRLLVDRGLDRDPLVRQDIARLEAGVRTIAANSARALAAVLRGGDPGAVASVNRLVKSEFEQHMHTLALRALGPYAALGSRAPDAIDKGRWTFGYLMSRATTIGAGTAEIQRNTIAETVLGLPSHRGERTRKAAVTPGAPLAVAQEDERELREVLAKALEARVDMRALLDVKRPFDGRDDAVWSALVAFGLPGLAVDESLGGAGARPRLLYAAIEEAAKALAPAPLVPTVTALDVAVAAGAAVVAERIAAGTTAAFAVPLHDSGWVTTGLELPEWDGSRLTGVVPIVAGAPAADLLLVLARDAGSDGEVLALVDPAADIVDIVAHQPLDLTTTVGAVTLSGAAAEVIARGDTLRHALRIARRQALLAVAADSVGVGSRALALAVDWAGERQQFGRPIGSFQAISHRLADMLVALEGARSLVLTAAEADPDASQDSPESEYLVDLAAAAALDAAVEAAQGAIQVHGGVGFTWEHPAHLLLRRAQSNAVLVGRPDALRDRAARDVVAALHAENVEQGLPAMSACAKSRVSR